MDRKGFYVVPPLGGPQRSARVSHEEGEEQLESLLRQFGYDGLDARKALLFSEEIKGLKLNFDIFEKLRELEEPI
jgi:hypothetical protein